MTTVQERGVGLTEPRWFPVVGGPLPIGAALRDAALALLVPLGLLILGLFVPLIEQILLVLLALGLSGALGVWARRRYHQRQQLRVLGNVLEHRDGDQVQRIALTRAVCSVAAGGAEVLVLVLDDGQRQLAVARRAEPHEVAGLPARMGLYLELHPEDYEEIRIAAHRSYARA